jgi:alpha-ribazole phosphatase
MTAQANRFPGNSGAAVTGRAALAALAATLPPEALWLTSPLARAIATADALRAVRPELAGERVVEDALAEQDFGHWQDRPYDEVWDTEDGRRFWDAPATNRPPGGESFTDVMARVSDAIGRWTKQAAVRDVVAVCHAGPIRAALCQARVATPEAALGYEIDNLSLTRIDHLGTAAVGWRVGFVNRVDVTTDS